MIESPAYPGDLVEHLRSFRALALRIEADPRGAFEATAEGLHLDASVLRRRVSALRDYYGGPLTEGRGSSLRLSAVGIAILEGAERVFGALGQLRVEAGATPRKLTIACTGTVTTELLPDVIVRLRRAYPELTVSVRRAGAAAARELLETGATDLAVVRAEDAPHGMDAKALCRDRLWLALPSRHELAKRRRLTMRDIATVPIVGYRERSSTRRRVMSVLGPLDADVRYEVDGRAAALRFVELGLGAAFLSLLPGHRIDVPSVHVRDVSKRFPPSYFFLCRKTGRAPGELELRAERIIRKLARARA